MIDDSKNIGAGIKNIQHIGIPTDDLDGSLAFYERLGFSSAMRKTFTHQGSTGEVLMVKHASIVIELYNFNHEHRAIGGIDHIAFNVTDIEASFKKMKEQGFTIQEDAPVFLPFWENGCKFFNIVGPNNERLEFNQIL